MVFSAPHIGFVIVAYAVSLIVICGLVLVIVVNDRVKTRKLADYKTYISVKRIPSNNGLRAQQSCRDDQ